jgi:hypothetical protein
MTFNEVTSPIHANLHFLSYRTQVAQVLAARRCELPSRQYAGGLRILRDLGV